MNSRIARAIQRNPVSKTNKQTNKKTKPNQTKKKKITDVFLESVDARRVCTHVLQKQQMPGF